MKRAMYVCIGKFLIPYASREPRTISIDVIIQ